MPGDVEVRFEPSGAVARVPSGTTLMVAASRVGLTIPAPCGGRGVCGACAVHVIEGELAPPDEFESVGLRRAPAGVRLACRARVAESPVVIRPIVVHGSADVATGAACDDGEASRALAVGVDLGTTTVSAQVMDAGSGDVLGVAAVANRQQGWGSDVLARVDAVLGGAGAELREAAEASVLDAIGAAYPDALVRPRAIERIAIAGNSVMTALLLGLPAERLSRHPFEAPLTGVGRLAASGALSDALVGDATSQVMPCIAAFVGGDTTAALIGTGMLDGTETRLLIDLGTNAEVALTTDADLWVASAAAGPAFEAAGTRCGGPAIPGGVIGVRIADDGGLGLDVVGGGEAMWIAGSGLISAIAALRSAGHIDADGRMTENGPWRDRFSHDADGVLGLSLAGGCEAGCVRIDQRDVRAFQLAKSAVYVAIDSVLDAARVKPKRVGEVLLAGAFGASLDPDDLVSLGVVPKEFRDRLRSVGDAALEGAARAAMRPSLAISAATRTAQARHVDLAAEPRFNEKLLKATALKAR